VDATAAGLLQLAAPFLVVCACCTSEQEEEKAGETLDLLETLNWGFSMLVEGKIEPLL
jgi:hypothetical protein